MYVCIYICIYIYGKQSPFLPALGDGSGDSWCRPSLPQRKPPGGLRRAPTTGVPQKRPNLLRPCHAKHGVKGNHPHVLHNFTSRVPNTTDGPQQNRWNGWSTVACWMTPHDKFFLLLRAMSLQNDAWYVPSKVSSFCSSKFQQNKNPVKHRRFEKHVRAKLPVRRVLWGYLKSPQQSVNTKSWSWFGWFGVQLF